MSLLFGLPLYSFHVSIGQYLGAGVIDMWRISPVFQGIGIALLASQALLGIYTIVGVSWMFVYLRDSFITKNDIYRWAEPLDALTEANGPVAHNGTFKIEETVPDYFRPQVVWEGRVRLHASWFGGRRRAQRQSRGDHSIGICIPRNGLEGVLSQQQESGNKKPSMLRRDTVLVASFTLLILVLSAFLANACVQLLHIKGNYEYIPSSFGPKEELLGLLPFKGQTLREDIANAVIECIDKNLIQRDKIVSVSTDRAEKKMSSYGFLWPLEAPVPGESEGASRYMTHVPLAMGEQVAIPWGPIHFGWTQSGQLELVGDATPSGRSGYQTLRLATEIVPSALALLRVVQFSPFWALAIWHCVITGVIAINSKKFKVWETTITFFTCAFGFLLGLTLTTERSSPYYLRM
ncbi:hypothetical protein J437_LFUL008939 [Ladona fulva]|uniref:Uncharacterized protein n=1 Tax=Ladona fulva TaxID=123851 RepID=A0A8K0KDK4_LADFU|nr:hypothetical protein J437_LFUL008939 [Ladona fulva]